MKHFIQFNGNQLPPGLASSKQLPRMTAPASTDGTTPTAGITPQSHQLPQKPTQLQIQTEPHLTTKKSALS